MSGQVDGPRQLERLPTHIAGFDLIASGGLPRGRATLIAGTSGSAKTVFACQFLAEGVRHGQGGVFVTFEEPPEAVRANVAGFGWDIAGWERDRKWAFVDVSPRPEEGPPVVTGSFDLSGLLVRIQDAVKRVGAERVSLDSLGGIFTQLGGGQAVRHELFRIVAALKQMGVTSVITAERPQDHGPVTRLSIEEFVADNVVILRNALEGEKRRRTVEILKFRGAQHQKGEFPFTVSSDGVVVIPLSAMELTQKSSDVRISSGNAELDRMCGGGFFRDSIILLSGATGTGKTLATAQFMYGGIEAGERSLLFAFEESREQLFRNAAGWGVDFARLEREGLLRVVCGYPEVASVEDHLISIKRHMDEFQPQRVAVDSLSALERVASVKSFREFAIGLTSFIKERNVAGLMTATSSSLLGGSSITEAHISTLTDSIILLRYVELYGEMRRGITVLKMRGSRHDKDIREFTIDAAGMHIGKPFRTVTGILSGLFSYRAGEEAPSLPGRNEG